MDLYSSKILIDCESWSSALGPHIVETSFTFGQIIDGNVFRLAFPSENDVLLLSTCFSVEGTEHLCVCLVCVVLGAVVLSITGICCA